MSYAARCIAALILLGCAACGGGGGGGGEDEPFTEIPPPPPVSAPLANESHDAAAREDAGDSARTALQLLDNTIRAVIRPILDASLSRGEPVVREVHVQCPEAGEASLVGSVLVTGRREPKSFTYEARARLNNCNGYTGTLNFLGSGSASRTEIVLNAQINNTIIRECDTQVQQLLVDGALAQGSLQGMISGTIVVDCGVRPVVCTFQIPFAQPDEPLEASCS